MTSVNIKQNDDKHGIYVIIKRDGEPEDLTGCTVKLCTHGYPALHMTVTDPENGEVFRSFEQSFTAKTGRRKAEINVQFPDGRNLTYPQKGYIEINIQKGVDCK